MTTASDQAEITTEPTAPERPLADFRADAARYIYYDNPTARPTPLRLLRAFAANQGLQAMALYRMGRFLYAKQPRGVLNLLPVTIGRLLHPLLVRLNDAVNGIWISRDAQIGGGLYIAHYGGVIIGHARIGANCNIGNNVTIGKSTEGSYEDVPTIGNRVSIAVGSRILGKISVGHDALVGPNSVVMRDVPQRGVVLGVPARQLAKHGSFNHVSYRGMELDEQRSQSLALIDKS